MLSIIPIKPSVYLSVVFIEISIENGIGADRAHGNQVTADEDDQHDLGGG